MNVTVLYLLTGVLTYIGWVVYRGNYEELLGFVVITLLWPLYWLIAALMLIKWGVDIIAYYIMRLVGKR